MNNNSPASAYQQSAARGASPVGLVVALYDTLLRDFRRALVAQDASQIETRVFELNHSLTVIVTSAAFWIINAVAKPPLASLVSTTSLTP